MRPSKWQVPGPDYPEFHPGRYGDGPPDVTGRDVYLVDFSYAAPVVEQMLAQARTVTLIDHHKTAIDQLRPLKERMVATNGNGRGDTFGWYCDLERSGAVLAWDYLFPTEPRPTLLGHVQDRDLWQFRLPHTREISADLFSHPYTFEAWDRLMAGTVADLVRMTATGAAILRKHDKDVAEVLATTARPMVINGLQLQVANAPHILASDVGQLLAQSSPHGIGASYWDTATHRQFSLRSLAHGPDVAALAQVYGGGGHEHAAGFRVLRDHPLAGV